MDDNKYTHLMKWGEENKIKIHKKIELKLITNKMGYGIRATGPIAEGATIISVPSLCHFSFQNTLFSKLEDVDQILDDFVLDSMQLLAIAFLFEKGKSNSFFVPYFSVLPSSFDTPMFWEESELAEFENTCLEEMLDLDKLANDFTTKIQVILDRVSTKYPEEKMPTFSFEEYKKALSIISSRAFQAEDGSPYLCPIIDMLNSNLQSNVQIGTAAGNLMAKVSTNIKEGDQILNNYGDFSNSELLRKYGYIEEDNKHDEVHIDMEEVSAVCCNLFGDVSESRIENFDFLENSEYIVLRKFSADDVTAFLDDITKVAELHLMDLEDFKLFQELVESVGVANAWKQYHEDSGGMDLQQVRVVALLVLARKLAGYPTTLEEDQAWLQGHSNEGDELIRKILAAKIRISEKTIIAEWMKHVKGPENKRKGISTDTSKDKRKKISKGKKKTTST